METALANSFWGLFGQGCDAECSTVTCCVDFEDSCRNKVLKLVRAKGNTCVCPQLQSDWETKPRNGRMSIFGSLCDVFQPCLNLATNAQIHHPLHFDFWGVSLMHYWCPVNYVHPHVFLSHLPLWCLMFGVTIKKSSVLKYFTNVSELFFLSISEEMMFWNMCRCQRMCICHIYIYKRETRMRVLVSICTCWHWSQCLIGLSRALCFCVPTVISCAQCIPCRLLWWRCTAEDVVKCLLFPRNNPKRYCSHIRICGIWFRI